MRDLIEDLGLVLQVRRDQLPRHVVIQVVQVRRNDAAGLEIEAAAQLIDDRSGGVQQPVLLRKLLVLHAAARLGNALQRAVHQHQDQPMRVRRSDASVG